MQLKLFDYIVENHASLQLLLLPWLLNESECVWCPFVSCVDLICGGHCSAVQGLEYPAFLLLSTALHCIGSCGLLEIDALAHTATVEWRARPAIFFCTRQCKHQLLLLLLLVIYTCVLCMEMRCLMINLMGSWGDAPS